MAGGSGGAAAGFAIGTTIMPGVGSIVGTIVGGKCLIINIICLGLIGGFAGEKISAKAYKSIEKKIIESKKKRKNKEMQELYSYNHKQKAKECKITEDRFDECLAILGVHCYKPSIEILE